MTSSDQHLPSRSDPARPTSTGDAATGATRGDAPTTAAGETPTSGEVTTSAGTSDEGETPASSTPGARSRADRKGTRFVFIDTEATGLDHDRHELTEVSWIVRFEDGREVERQFFPQHTIDGADADALELTHYDERIAPRTKTPASEWLRVFLDDADGAVLVGAVPDFDAKHLDRMCRKLGLSPTWDHHLLDVETLALPLIAPGPEAPRSLAKTCAALGLPHDKDQAHGALYDAKQAMRAFDRVWELLAELRADGAPLPAPVPRNGGTSSGGTSSGGTSSGGTSSGGTSSSGTSGGPARSTTAGPDPQPSATEGSTGTS